MGVELLIDYYHDKRPDRADEFFLCLRRNLANPEVDWLWNLGTDDESIPNEIRSHAKYRSAPVGQRLTFRKALDFANAELPGKFVGLINLDIYLDTPPAGWAEAERLVRQSNVVLCQARCDLQPDGSIARDPGYARLAFANTQDGWFFVPPIEIPNIDFELGTLGCDNAFAHRLRVAGKLPVNMGSRYKLIHVDICRGKHAGNANSVHQSESQQRQSTYSTFPERKGCYLVPDIDMIGDLERLAQDLRLSDLQKYQIKCDLMSSVIAIWN